MPHVHSHGGATTMRRVGLSVGLTLAFVIGEAVAGSWSHSLALLSDAGHNFADALALVFSWYALRASRRPASARWTFGYHRIGILAALVNAVTLVVIALAIFWEAWERCRAPVAIRSGPVIVTAAVAVVLNGLIGFWLHRQAQHDLNVRSAYLHMLGDAVSAVGVVIAGIIVACTGSTLADPIVSFLIGGLILWSSWGVLVEAVNVLLENTPLGLDMHALKQALAGVTGVLDVHDLHVWTIASQRIACSCHLVVAEQSLSSSQDVRKAAAETLRQRFHIGHATIQIEVGSCDLDSLYCTFHPVEKGCGQPHSH